MDEPIRKPVDGLYCDSVDVKSQYQSWFSDDEDSWCYWEAAQCEECGEYIALTYYTEDRHSDIDPDSECDGMVYASEGPMMSYFYPVPESSWDDYDESEMALAIRYLPLCVVRVGGELGLALTGGGMDLSWDICEAYMLLGWLPPVHFCDLPDYGHIDEERRWVVEGCKRSCDVLVRWTENTREKLDSLRGMEE